MSLFEVKDWDVPSHAALAASNPPSRTSRKRKRAATEADRVQSAQLNVEKLMRMVEKGTVEHARETKRIPKDASHKGKKQPRGGNASHQRTTALASLRKSASSTSKRTKDKPPPSNVSPHSTSEHAPPGSIRKKKPINKANSAIALTFMQASMKESLDGARFRWINEMMYTTGSQEGHELMRNDPKLYQEYHTGFRQQVRSWPINPISHYISVLSSYPRGTVIADLGCGDAALARSLIPKGFCVLSFDLVPDGAFVLEADVCDRIPLPGAEDAANESQGQVVDVCVCALSLMSLDWIQCIRESWRILRHGGELKIAEVASRFIDVHQFTTIIGDLGFKLISTDESNTHFTLFEFRKIARPPLCDRKWEDLRGKHGVLKPCEYKRR